MLRRFRGALLLATLLLVTGPAAGRDGLPMGPFLLRSDPWVNLHYFLYHEARNTVRRDDRLRGRVRSYREDRQVTLDDPEATIWRASLEVYARYGDRHLIFDDGLREIGNTVLLGPDAFPDGPAAEPIFAAPNPTSARRWRRAATSTSCSD